MKHRGSRTGMSRPIARRTPFGHDQGFVVRSPRTSESQGHCGVCQRNLSSKILVVFCDIFVACRPATVLGLTLQETEIPVLRSPIRDRIVDPGSVGPKGFPAQSGPGAMSEPHGPACEPADHWMKRVCWIGDVIRIADLPQGGPFVVAMEQPGATNGRPSIFAALRMLWFGPASGWRTSITRHNNGRHIEDWFRSSFIRGDHGLSSCGNVDLAFLPSVVEGLQTTCCECFLPDSPNF